ncbi:MAG: hypothetical protein ABFD50_14875 [Smithella sp.]
MSRQSVVLSAAGVIWNLKDIAIHVANKITGNGRSPESCDHNKVDHLLHAISLIIAGFLSPWKGRGNADPFLFIDKIQISERRPNQLMCKSNLHLAGISKVQYIDWRITG